MEPFPFDCLVTLPSPFKGKEDNKERDFGHLSGHFLPSFPAFLVSPCLFHSRQPLSWALRPGFLTFPRGQHWPHLSGVLEGQMGWRTALGALPGTVMLRNVSCCCPSDHILTPRKGGFFLSTRLRAPFQSLQYNDLTFCKQMNPLSWSLWG